MHKFMIVMIEADLWP